jgi:hypothetical protein
VITVPEQLAATSSISAPASLGLNPAAEEFVFPANPIHCLRLQAAAAAAAATAAAAAAAVPAQILWSLLYLYTSDNELICYLSRPYRRHSQSSVQWALETMDLNLISPQ